MIFSHHLSLFLGFDFLDQLEVFFAQFELVDIDLALIVLKQWIFILSSDVLQILDNSNQLTVFQPEELIELTLMDFILMFQTEGTFSVFNAHLDTIFTSTFAVEADVTPLLCTLNFWTVSIELTKSAWVLKLTEVYICPANWGFEEIDYVEQWARAWVVFVLSFEFALPVAAIDMDPRVHSFR